MSNKSGVSAQAVTLPSGGGAVQGIGETFSPDLFTGTGTITVPLGVPPGRNGLQPDLALVYSAGNGNGPFGLGWQLNVPEISRKTSKGVPRYRNAAAGPAGQDIFILSGSEDLVPIAQPEPGVTRFRPRTEGLFARIERVAQAGEDFWRVLKKEGRVSIYGRSRGPGAEPSVVADPAQRARIFCWYLTETIDPYGNRIEYEYLRDRGSDGPHNWDQLYLQSVRYADYQRDGATRFLVSVTFIYEERPDPFSEYRAGFEIRTRLRCKRVEVRTHADEERLSRTWELVYVDERVAARELTADSLPLNGSSLLSQVRVVGHDGDRRQEMAPLEFGYTPFVPGRQRFQSVQGDNTALPPRSLADPDFEMVSLFANGLPDIVQMNGSVQFWRNLGNGRYAAPLTMSEVPAGVHLRDPGVQFADMNGNGRADLVVLEQAGYFPLTFEGRWSPKGPVRFRRTPSVGFGDNHTRLTDLDGDGVIDALRTGTSFELFFNDPVDGWAPPEVVARGPLEAFPNVDFADPRVKLADMSGDNLQDLVLVEQGRIDYWPFLGHGRWGRRITMQNSPVFRDAIPQPGGTFDPQRVLLGDIDGDGLDDIVYVEPNRLTFWINQGGRGWSDPVRITDTPPLSHPDAVRLVDLLGTGMAGVLWTSDQTTGAGSNFQFLDLTGGAKPYLLERKDNHMGAVTRIGYASSTKFYLADVATPQTRWKTPLPFPVQVIDRVEVLDALSGGKLTTEYRYHHGYWDGAEREFRGFGRVEQFDSEVFDNFNAPGLHAAADNRQQVPARSFSPPLLTRTWFHPGPIGDEFAERSEADFGPEYWPGDPPTLARPVGSVDLLRALPATQRGDALRALRGQVLRTELYALDGSDRQDRPFTVNESQYGLAEVDPPADSSPPRKRVFFPHAVAHRTTQWERGDEPQTQFTFSDDFDAYGQPRRRVNLAVPRGRDYRVPAPAAAPYLGSVNEIRYVQRDDGERYMVDRVAASASFQIVNDGSQTIFDLYRQVQNGTARRELLGQSFNYYDGEPFVGLPLGEPGDFGALVRSEALVLTEEILASAYRDPADPTAPPLPPYLRPSGVLFPAEYPREFQDDMPSLAGYTFADGSDGRPRGYFVQSTRVAFDFQTPGAPRRGLPLATRDALGNETRLAYDRPFHLLPVETTDPAGLAVRAEHDYRVLQTRQVTDFNGNRRAVSFSPLGLVEAAFVMGKAGEQAGDTPGAPGRRLAYDFLAFVNRGQPVNVRSSVREHHPSETDVPLPERDALLETIEYSDGFGRLLQTRHQAEDGLFGDAGLDAPLFGDGVLPPAGGRAPVAGRQRAAANLPNVVVSGWQIYNNKGQVVERFEPFFSAGFDYLSPQDEQSRFGRDVLGQRVTSLYDARGQVVRTTHADGSQQRVIHGIPADLANPEQFAPTPWEAYTYDANDLAPRSAGPDGASLANAAAAAHHFTPWSIEIDGLGRTVLTVERNRAAPPNATDPLPPIEEMRTRTAYDIRGNVLTVRDALGRVAVRCTYDLADRPWRVDSADGGTRRMVLNALSLEVERRDARGALTLQAYDRLLRPIRLWARDDAGGPLTLRRHMAYGDDGDPAQPAAQRAERRAANLLGQVQRHHDEAGLTIVEGVDFKGNVLAKTRRMIADAPILAAVDAAAGSGFQIVPFQIDWQPAAQGTLGQREAELLETTVYQTSSAYDALNRVKLLRLPQDVEGRRRELRSTYNRGGGLEQLRLDDGLFVERLAYDASGRRTLIAYGDPQAGTGLVMTRYAYDPHTLRLQRLRSERYDKPDALTYRPRGEAVQDCSYAYDLAGNIVSITDRAPGSGILNNPEALAAGDPELAQLLAGGDALVRRFTYDAVYRLLSATGRECDRPPDGPPVDDRPRCADLTRARGYREQYSYDVMGNLRRLEHHSGAEGFVRRFALDPASNRLREIKVGDTPFAYVYDANGNLTAETTARHYTWNHADQLQTFRTQPAGAEPSIYSHYLYDAAGQRVKKLVRTQGGAIEVTHYVDGVFEHHRWRGGAGTGENNNVHVMDDQRRIALIRLGPAHPDDRGPGVQFHLGDHLGSSHALVDAAGEVASREEYTPYGETSFGSFARKRYRFCAMERDGESGLNYHGARYYAPWLGRWTSCDPSGSGADLNLFLYADASPIVLVDPVGREPLCFPVSEEAQQRFHIGPRQCLPRPGRPKKSARAGVGRGASGGTSSGIAGGRPGGKGTTAPSGPITEEGGTGPGGLGEPGDTPSPAGTPLDVGMGTSGSGDPIATGSAADKQSKAGSARDRHEGSGREKRDQSGSGVDPKGGDVGFLTQLASLIIDPSSLAEAKGKSGNGSPVGSSFGFIGGPLASFLTIVVAILSLGGGSLIKKALGKVRGALGWVRGKLGGLLGPKAPKALPGTTPKALPPGEPSILTDPPVPPEPAPGGGGPFRTPPPPPPPPPEPPKDPWSIVEPGIDKTRKR